MYKKRPVKNAKKHVRSVDAVVMFGTQWMHHRFMLMDTKKAVGQQQLHW
jgi:hypothetical protein